MMRYLIYLISIAFLISCGSDDDSSGSSSKEAFQSIVIENGSSLNFNLYANVDVSSSGSSQYRNLLLYMHGASLDGEDYYDSAKRAVSSAGKSDDTIVVAPQFQTEDTKNNYVWGQYSWKNGDFSNNGEPKISSYAVLDRLLMDYVLANYPSIENVILAGHSAGGQLIYRYALLTDLPEQSGLLIHWLPMNPSSYAYIGPERWDDTAQAFVVPSDIPACPHYNSWIYGLENLSSNQYDSSISPTAVAALFPERLVTIGVGTNDTGTPADQGCEADLMGPNRFERGVLANKFIDFKDQANQQALIEVQGVGHDGAAMINSQEIVQYISQIFE